MLSQPGGLATRDPMTPQPGASRRLRDPASDASQPSSCAQRPGDPATRRARAGGLVPHSPPPQLNTPQLSEHSPAALDPSARRIQPSDRRPASLATHSPTTPQPGEHASAPQPPATRRAQPNGLAGHPPARQSATHRSAARQAQLGSPTPNGPRSGETIGGHRPSVLAA